jgi:hypothetical protein
MTRPFEVSLAPQQLWQAINPWSFYNQGAQFGLINVNLGQTAAPETERAILDEVGSYGKQLGHIGDALEVLIARLPMETLTAAEREAIVILEGQLAEIRKIKRRERNAAQSGSGA